MLISETATCKVTGTNRKRLILLGYNVKDVAEIEVLIKDLTPHAGYPVEVKCDYCGNTTIKRYYKYLKGRKKIPKDCCQDCVPKKQSEMRDAGLVNAHKSNPKLRKRDIKQVLREFDEAGYDLLEKEYINNETHMNYICRTHPEKGVQKITYAKFFSVGQGCRFCGIERRNEAQRHSIDFVKNVIENEYKEDGCKLISKTYTNYYEKDLIIMCRCGNYFTTSLSVFKTTKRSCAFCKQSEGASNVQEFLEDNGCIFEKEKVFKDLVSDGGNPLRFDFTIVRQGKIYCIIEYDGEFHYKKFFEEQDLEKQKYHDKLKNEYCIKNNIPLIRIPYWEKDNISEILTDIFICKNSNSKFIINNSMGVCDYGKGRI